MNKPAATRGFGVQGWLACSGVTLHTPNAATAILWPRKYPSESNLDASAPPDPPASAPWSAAGSFEAAWLASFASSTRAREVRLVARVWSLTCWQTRFTDADFQHRLAQLNATPPGGRRKPEQLPLSIGVARRKNR